MALRIGLRNGIAAFKVALMAALLLIAVSGGYFVVLAFQKKAEWQVLASYNITFMLGQARAELQKFQAALLRQDIDPAAPDRVVAALDVLATRTDVLRGGAVFATLATDVQAKDVVRDLQRLVARAAGLVDRLQPGDRPAGLLDLAHDVDALERDLAALVSMANAQNSRRTADSERALENLFVVFIGLFSGLVGCGLGLLHLSSRLQANVTAVRQSETEISLQKSRFEAALNNMSQALCMVDGDFRPIVHNIRFQQMFGVAPGPVGQVRDAGALLCPDDPRTAFSSPDTDLLRSLWQHQQAWQRSREGGQAVVDHGSRAILVVHRPTEEGGWVATYSDVTEARRAEARMRHMAHHDSLTELPNRTMFRTRLERALLEHGRAGDGCAVMYLDLDNFKTVNDTLGHPAGDALLVQVARRLKGCVRDTDMVARLGGDEFAILQFGGDQQVQAAKLATRLIAALQAPFELGGQNVVVGTSVGIALVPDDGRDADQLMRNSDMALFKAKADGRGNFRFFNRQMDREIRDQHRIETELRGAMDRHELSVAYQPQRNIASGRISACEALLRWDSHVLGRISPARFIPVAEKIGLIGALGAWVLREACQAATTWPGGVSVAVNLSPVQFRTSDIVAQVAAVLTETGLPAGRLELEITETVLLQDSDRVMRDLLSLHEMGIKISLDDFGTGYSSPSYLLRFPFDKIKIDRTFVGESETPLRALAIVRSITGLARDLGMTTTAEGVETEAQYRQMQIAGCTDIQGYLVSRPVPLAELAGVAGWTMAPAG